MCDHILTLSLPLALINECWDCDKKFNTKKALSDHMRTHNKKDKNINCDVCDFKTDRKFNLKQHQKVHDKVPSDPLTFPTLDGHEDKHKFKVTRNIGTDKHLRKAIQSHTSFNSLRVGSPNRIMSIKKKSPNSPLARPT